MTEQQFDEMLQKNGESAIMPAIQKIAEVMVEMYTQGCKDGIEIHKRVSNEGVDEWKQEVVNTTLDELINKLKGNGKKS